LNYIESRSTSDPCATVHTTTQPADTWQKAMRPPRPSRHRPDPCQARQSWSPVDRAARWSTSSSGDAVRL